MMTMVTAHQLDQDQDLLTEMRILSSLRPNDRITTNHATKPVVRIQQPSFFRPVFRLVGNESRISNIAYIQSLFQRLIDRFKAADRFSDNALVGRLRTEALATMEAAKDDAMSLAQEERRLRLAAEAASRSAEAAQAAAEEEARRWRAKAEDLESELGKRVRTVREPPRWFRGLLRQAFMMALRERHWRPTAAWKLFVHIPRMLLA